MWRFQPKFGDNGFQLVHATADDPTPIDWDRALDVMRKDRRDAANWPDVFAQLQQQVGDRWGDFVAMLARNASLLPATRGNAYDPADLLELELQRATAAVGTSLQGQIHSRRSRATVDRAGRFGRPTTPQAKCIPR